MDLQKLKEKGICSLYGERITVGTSTCGIAAGALKVKESLNAKGVGCLGFCSAEPLVSVQEDGKAPIVYRNVKELEKAEILGWFYPWEFSPLEIDHPELEGHHNLPHLREHPFYRKQVKIVLRNCGVIEPLSIEQYIAMGGYHALQKALEMKPEEIIEEIKKSGLRGRGGAGFPTGMKWEIARKNEGEKFVICNADEGDPGAYMDRSVLEGDPFSVIEGMTIGAYAVGSNKGFIYVRNEYPLAVRTLEEAVKIAKDNGFLGENIMDSDFSFEIHIVKGAGAFVCGEETALIASIEGYPGEPRIRPPYPAEKGLWEKPTVINNVETWANIPVIILKGWKFFASFGTEKSKGTKVFSVVGKVKNTGLIEVPMGISLREIVLEIGEADDVKAVQTGGPTGGCVPFELMDVPVDYERLVELGSVMGSGGLVVIGNDSCMVDVAKYFLEFTKAESCGKCIPCRLGLNEMFGVILRITQGEGSQEDIERLEKLADIVATASLCGLGKTAPNPLLTTLKYFREEYLEHIRGRCPAGVCRALVRYSILPEKCVSCGLCEINCPVGAIKKTDDVFSIDQDLCIKCGSCFKVCKFDAVERI
ncbi:MAG: NADH-quinone oxidoreductase subunit [Archaeoglobaceae archaeon]|nr:NADH-quinone oxidoreductase subunit [Archaeoglobaceae archaeon]